jgi:6-pyruvoyltetrahydropterin/6-carboxytetrahydropterin synthase
MQIFKKFTFEAAHRLPNVPQEHKCYRLHGHSYQIEIHVAGEAPEPAGWIIDFADITAAFQPIFGVLDHNYLNDVEGLSNPTSENLAVWIWERMIVALPQLTKVVVQETCASGCIYNGKSLD